MGPDTGNVVLGGKDIMHQVFPIKTNVKYMWRDQDGALHIGIGVTGHISRRDVYIVTDQAPLPGTKIEVLVQMEPRSNESRCGWLMGKGVALRVEHAEGRSAAFAAQVVFQRHAQLWLSTAAPPNVFLSP